MTRPDDDHASDLLIQEVDEDLRRESMERVWTQYGSWFIAGAVAIVVAVAGFQVWQNQQLQLRKEEALRYSAALVQAEAGKAGEAVLALGSLAKDSRTGYALMARLTEAKLTAESDTAKAAELYGKIAADTSIPVIYRDLAVLQGAILSLDNADPAQVKAKVEPLAASGPWRYSANEVLALLAQREGDPTRSRELYRQIADDTQAPPAIRARASEMLAALGGADKPTDKVKG